MIIKRVPLKYNGKVIGHADVDENLDVVTAEITEDEYPRELFEKDPNAPWHCSLMIMNEQIDSASLLPIIATPETNKE